MKAIDTNLSLLDLADLNEDYIVQVKGISEGVRAISKLMIENRKGKSTDKK